SQHPAQFRRQSGGQRGIGAGQSGAISGEYRGGRALRSRQPVQRRARSQNRLCDAPSDPHAGVLRGGTVFLRRVPLNLAPRGRSCATREIRATSLLRRLAQTRAWPRELRSPSNGTTTSPPAILNLRANASIVCSNASISVWAASSALSSSACRDKISARRTP